MKTLATKVASSLSPEEKKLVDNTYIWRVETYGSLSASEKASKNWPNCEVPDCEYKACVPLGSTRCFPHEILERRRGRG